MEIKKRFDQKKIPIKLRRIESALGVRLRAGYDPSIPLPKIGSGLIKGDDGKKKRKKRKRRRKGKGKKGDLRGRSVKAQKRGGAKLLR